MRPCRPIPLFLRLGNCGVRAALSGPDWRCPGATDEELLGLLNRCGTRAPGTRRPPRWPSRCRVPTSCSTSPGRCGPGSPRIGALLAGGVIDAVKAGIIVTEFLVLDDEKAAAAEALIAHQLAGKTASQIGRRPHLHPRTHEVPRRDETIPLRTNKALSCLITGSTSIGADCSRRAGGVRRGAVPT